MFRLGLLLCLLAIFASSCTDSSDDSSDTNSETPTGIAEVDWRLFSFADRDLINLSIISLRIGEDGGVSGFSGCNNYTAEAVFGDGNALRFRNFSSTEISCNVPENVNAQEEIYYQALNLVQSWAIRQNQMALTLSTGELLVFVAR